MEPGFCYHFTDEKIEAPWPLILEILNVNEQYNTLSSFTVLLSLVLFGDSLASLGGGA